MFIPILALFAFLNRLRGGGWFAPKLPSRPLFWVAGFIELFGYMILTPMESILFTSAYLFWGFFAWGRWYDLGHMPELERKPNKMERIINSISHNNDYIALYIRMAFASPFLAFINIWIAMFFPLFILLVYHVSWKVRPENPIPLAEMLVGGIWGLIFIYMMKV